MKYPNLWLLIGNFFIWFILAISIWAIFFKPVKHEPSFRYRVEPSFSVEHKPSFHF